MILAETRGDPSDRPAIASTDRDDAYLEIIGARKQFRQTVVIDGLDLQVRRGEFVSLLGPSGCGKTTLLKMIAGLLTVDGGSIVLDGHSLTRLPAHKRNIGVVFQNYALFPHLTVAENVAFGLKARHQGSAQIDETVRKYLELVHLPEFADRSIVALSGGQQQRVAVARALAVRPVLFLLDEPFSALDRKLREAMQIELRHLLQELEITAIFVTHDQDEALVMSHRIAVMSEGRIEQFAEPAVIYDRPETGLVLDFVGMSTRLRGRVTRSDGNHVTVETTAGAVNAPGRYNVGANVVVAVRPENMTLGTVHGPDVNVLDLVLRDRVFFGSKVMLHFDMADGDRGIAEVTPAAGAGLGLGNRVAVGWPISSTLIFSEK